MLKKYAVRKSEALGWVVYQTNSKARGGSWVGHDKDRAKADEMLAWAEAEEAKRQEKLRAARERRKAENAERRAKMRAELKVGSLLVTCWGYEQTNREFYEVVGTYGRFGLVLRQVKTEHVRGTGPFSAAVRPRPGAFCGEPFRKLLGPFGVSFESYRTARPAKADRDYHVSWGH